MFKSDLLTNLPPNIRILEIGQKRVKWSVWLQGLTQCQLGTKMVLQRLDKECYRNSELVAYHPCPGALTGSAVNTDVSVWEGVQSLNMGRLPGMGVLGLESICTEIYYIFMILEVCCFNVRS